MVSCILVMAKVFAPPRNHTSPATIPPLTLDSPSHSQDLPVAQAEPGLIHIADSVGEKEVFHEKSSTSFSRGGDQDNFSIEFTRLQAEEASERETLERTSPISSLPIGYGIRAQTTTRSILGVLIPSPPNLLPHTRPQSNF
jgi:hypothetical protein